MKLVILTMKDTKVGIYTQPFAVLSIPAGVRDLTEMVNAEEKQLPWQKFPGDFELYHSGDHDSDTGRITPKDPEFIINLGTLKA